MTAPIKTPAKAPPAPQRSAPVERPATTLSEKPFGEKRPAFGGLGRGDIQASRSALSKALQDTPVSADGMFFSQLLLRPSVPNLISKALAGAV